ncbi:DUF3247 family protein [Pinirhizobacter sp.]|jgi:hypothetical protein|uniref:DUF3247 family protein n=1 Tax=Pinirhizobacter sp. TaxID=2950432 RepID=UPI002F40A962
MSKYAPQVYTDPGDIARLETLVSDLPDNACVSVVEHDGTTTTGVVAALPTVQSFRDEKENEGMNGVVRLEDTGLPGGYRTIWLDRIERVIQLDSVKGSPAS